VINYTPSYTLRGLLTFIAVVACCLGIGRALGFVLGTSFTVLVGCYLVASYFSLRVRIVLLIVALSFALLPWFGIPGYSFATIGPNPRLLPYIDLPEALVSPLSAVYWLAAAPPHLAGDFSHEFAELVFFPRGKTAVRPFVVFVLWLGIAIVLFLSIGFSLLAQRRRSHAPSGSENPAATFSVPL